ncbi:MAG: hypothetical protein WAO58_12095 [Fimbriimonadaceae bacterium]
MLQSAKRGLLFVISGPSGAGKGTLLERLSQGDLGLSRVRTYTTRPPRTNETEADYAFISREEFFGHVESGEIWEHTRTYGDHYYGSPVRLLQDEGGSHLLTEVEVKGMLRLREFSARRVVSIFVLPPSIEELGARIEKRHAEVNSQARIDKALDQIGYASAYDYILLNKDMEEFLARAETIARAELLRSLGIPVLLEHFGDALLKS